MMYPGQCVQIEEGGEVFILLRVDRKRHLADLLRPSSVNKVETGIPLAALRLFREPIPEELAEG
jgi:hypothetical protein